MTFGSVFGRTFSPTFQPKSIAAASGETAISAQSGWITVRNGDVLTVYIDGLAGDTTTPDWTTRWFEDSGTAGVAVASIATDAITAAALKADAVTKIQANLALEATLTAIKGAGWTNETLAAIDLLIDAIKAKTDQLTFTTANKVDASATVDPTGIATSAALAVVDANVDAIKLKTDALDNSAVNFVTSVVGSTITILRGDTLRASLLNLGSLAQYVSLDFTVKLHSYDTDDDALIRVRKNASGLTDGLVRLNGSAHTTGTDGSITIDDAPTGDVTIALKANITDDLAPGTYVYDIQLIEAAEVTTLTSGTLLVTPDITRLVA